MSTFSENYNRWWKAWWTEGPNVTRPKVKRHELTYEDVGMLPINGPKWWNKAKHVRPQRRAWKRIEQQLTYCPDDWYGIDLPLPNRKPHEYWW